MKKKKVSELKKIKELLSIKDPPTDLESMIKINKENLIISLAEAGISKAVVDYDGSGDSGQVESVCLYNKKNDLVQISKLKEKVRIYEGRSNYTPDKGGWTTVFSEVSLTMEEALSLFAELLLDYKGIDWFNNDGGYGTLTVDIESEVLRLEHTERVMSENHSSMEF